ncbi:MAG: hypothetical protein IPG04_19420 [Polyangiaceae bacterium]|jgi:hypothetical protein|nr:hypothetical protein [Polyangiaceae bacterium]
MVRAREEARTIAEQGLAKMDAGDFAAAARLLEVAEQRFHAPTHLLFLGQAYTGLGRLAKAASMYRRLLSEQVPNYAPDAFREAQLLGKKELAALEPRVPQVALELDRDAALVELTVDGEKVAFESPLWLDPGDHVLSATAGGVTKVERVSVREAERSVVRFAFGRAEAPPPEGPAGRGLGPLALGGIAALSIGGAALVVGAATGGVSLSTVAELEDRCPGKTGCDPADEALADEARLLGDVSTATLVIGGAAAVTGLILVLVPSPEAPGSTSLRPLIGPGFLGLTGAF